MKVWGKLPVIDVFNVKTAHYLGEENRTTNRYTGNQTKELLLWYNINIVGNTYKKRGDEYVSDNRSD